MLAGIKHLGCLAHVRRRFDEALKAQKHPSGRAKEALDMIGKLYHIEATVKKKTPPEGSTLVDEVYRWRQEKSRPILDTLHTWLVKNQAEVMPQSLIGKAISYALGQWLYIYRYIDDGRAPIGRVEMWRGGSRFSPAAPFPHPPHRTGRADFPHPALFRRIKPSRSSGRVQLAAGVSDPISRRGAGRDTGCTPFPACRCAFAARFANAGPYSHRFAGRFSLPVLD